MDTEQYEEAVRDYEKVYQTEKTKEHKQLLKNAQLELKKSKRKDYYKILGVDKNASEDEIKKAYRKRALMHHPDRHSGASAEVQKEEEKKFKEVGEAFTILSDPKKKTRYDSGQDLDEEGMNMGGELVTQPGVNLTAVELGILLKTLQRESLHDQPATCSDLSSAHLKETCDVCGTVLGA
ncbi:DnaJ heat shock protein family (Hsp40) member C7 [Phyllostomus discolor]|uniref:DnaJ heat shock protein family (Hsp40) member C7 n=1 Tax=Phyllostomus discolor TaxID=89673 RepID=A0A834DX05_9CHIR|nr:DnaJ heat shock protein family (Hsp40) member C7 [Phyllostomus discolor]